MNVWFAVGLVGLGSVLFRLAPLLGAERLPDGLTRVAGWAGLAVLTALTVRGVLHHEDPSVPAAPVIAALSVGCGLLLAFRGRPLLAAVGAGASAYLLLSALTRLG